MKLGKVMSVDYVGKVDESTERLLKSFEKINIWSDRERMIRGVWERYRERELEHVLENNIKAGPEVIDGKEYGKVTINWLETYEFFPCLHDLLTEDPEQFFREIEEPYNYNASFLLEHFSERRMIFNYLEYGLGSWDWITRESLSTFFPYSEQAKQLLLKIVALNREYDPDYALSNYSLGINRFITAQDSGRAYLGTATYATALEEIKNGKKRSHWIWYVFPQMEGLGHSELSKYYGIRGRSEAVAYIQHPVLRERLVEVCEAVLNNEKSVYEIFGQDAVKVRSCVLLFASVSDIPVFKQLIRKYRW